MTIAPRLLFTSIKTSTLAFLGITTLAASCVQDQEVQLSLAMRAPLGILDGATSVTLDVFSEGEATCNGATGSVTGSGKKASHPLGQTGCAPGASWCKEIHLPRDETTRVFSVTAKGEGGTLIAQGCSNATIDQDPLEVRIDIKPPAAERCCGDGIVQVGEQCDSGINSGSACMADTGGSMCGGIDADSVCSCNCMAEEILLSIPSALGAALLNNDPNTKSGLTMAFAGSNGVVAGALRAVFEDGPAGGPPDEVNSRLLKPTLHPFPYDEQNPNNPHNAYAFQLHLPSCANPYQHPFASRRQITPSIATVSDDFAAIVYASNQTGDLTQFSIYLNEQGPDGCSDGSMAISKAVTTSAEFPDVAPGPGGATLVVWRDGDELRGRIRQKDGSLEPADTDLSFGKASPDGRPRLAGTANGWTLVHAGAGNGDTDGIWLTSIKADGVADAPTLVNVVTDGVQSQPDIAQLQSGELAVVWRNGSQVFLQRYDASHKRIAGDQDEALNPNGAAAVEADRQSAGAPVVAAGTQASPWFVAAWETSDGTIHARYIGANKEFGYNTVDGSNHDFNATHPGITTARRDPAVAISDGYVAIGWVDTSVEHPGVYVRRFAVPN